MKPHLWFIHFIGLIVPRRLRADWHQEWEAELQHRELLLAEWDRLTWRRKLDLLWRSTSAFWDALWLQSYRWEDEMIQDLRFGVRMLLKQPGFTLIAVLTLAMGIGANTAIFSVVNALLLRPLPYMEAERLVFLSERSREGERLDVAYPNFADWRERAQSFLGMSAEYTRSFILTGVEKPARLEAWVGNSNFFELLGVNPQLGRLFTGADDRYGAARTVVLSHELWRSRFGGDVDLIGKAIVLDDHSYTVIGVAPPGFEYLEPVDLYVPIGLFLAPDSPLINRGNTTYLHGLARLKSGVTLEQANSEMATLGEQLAQEYPAVNGGKSAQAESLHHVLSENVRQSLWVLLAAVGFILLIAWINVAMDQLLGNSLAQRRLTLVLLASFAALALLLAAVGIYGVISYAVRQRTHEVGIRMALGAQTRDVLSLILFQGLRLALLGVALGLGAALALTRWMGSLLFDVRPTDPLTFGVIAAALLFVALAACWIPARRATKVDPMMALRQE